MSIQYDARLPLSHYPIGGKFIFQIMNNKCKGGLIQDKEIYKKYLESIKKYLPSLNSNKNLVSEIINSIEIIDDKAQYEKLEKIPLLQSEGIVIDAINQYGQTNNKIIVLFNSGYLYNYATDIKQETVERYPAKGGEWNGEIMALRATTSPSTEKLDKVKKPKNTQGNLAETEKQEEIKGTINKSNIAEEEKGNIAEEEKGNIAEDENGNIAELPENIIQDEYGNIIDIDTDTGEIIK